MRTSSFPSRGPLCLLFATYKWLTRPFFEAIERSTACLLGIYSVVTLTGQAFYGTGDIPFQPTSWYRKQQATFGDVLAAIRRQLWGNFSYSTSPHDPNLLLIPLSDLARLAQAACSSL